MGMSFVHVVISVAFNSELRLLRSDVFIALVFWCFGVLIIFGAGFEGLLCGDKGGVYSYRVSKFLSFTLWGDAV
jgi:hypothetical protein